MLYVLNFFESKQGNIHPYGFASYPTSIEIDGSTFYFNCFLYDDNSLTVDASMSTIPSNSDTNWTVVRIG